MDPNETMVEEFDDTATDDTSVEGIAEETDESEEVFESLNGDEEQAAEEQTETAPKAKEPGYVQKRIEKAVAKALAQQQAEFDRQMAPIREKMLNDEAQALVKSGEFKSLERAKEYLQLKQGLPVTANVGGNEQPRNSNGQFAQKDDPGTTARIKMLTHQADRIKASGGPDVIGEFRSNPEVKQKVIAGEMDFYDVAEQMKKPRKRPPSPMRSPNGASGQNPNAIDSMSDEQFDKLEKRIKEGARIRLS